MTRLDLLATMLTLPLALLEAKNIAARSKESGRSETPPNVEARMVDAASYGLRAGAGHGEHNAVVLQRAVDDLAVVGGTLLIPTGYYEVASPIRLAVTAGDRRSKRFAIVGDHGAILSTPGDNVFTISDAGQPSRIEIRGLHLRGNLGRKT